MTDTVIDFNEEAAESGASPHAQHSTDGFYDEIQSRVSGEVAGQLWQVGKQSTQKLINTYAHIDFLRPYFDVEPSEFRNRLFLAFLPRKTVGAPQDVPSELYGPMMLTLSLVAVLLYGMKSSGHEVEEGTLIGTALAICFGYWLGVSSLLFFIAYVVNAHLSMVQVFSLTGYSLCGHCSVLLLSIISDHYGSPGAFYLYWIITGGLSGLKMVGVYISRSWSLREGLVLGCVSFSIHMSSILYLRWEYNKVYEALSEVF